MLIKGTEGRQDYYHGYFTALQDIAKEVGEGGFDSCLTISDELIQRAIKDIMKETEIETKSNRQAIADPPGGD